MGTLKLWKVKGSLKAAVSSGSTPKNRKLGSNQITVLAWVVEDLLTAEATTWVCGVVWCVCGVVCVWCVCGMVVVCVWCGCGVCVVCVWCGVCVVWCVCGCGVCVVWCL